MSRVHHLLLSTQHALDKDNGMEKGRPAVDGSSLQEAQLETCAEGVLDRVQKLAVSHRQDVVSNCHV